MNTFVDKEFTFVKYPPSYFKFRRYERSKVSIKYYGPKFYLDKFVCRVLGKSPVFIPYDLNSGWVFPFWSEFSILFENILIIAVISHDDNKFLSQVK